MTRIPVRRLYGRSRATEPKEDAVEEKAVELLTTEGLEVVRHLGFTYRDDAGVSHRTQADIAIFKGMLIIEFDRTEQKAMSAVMEDLKRERAMRSEGWEVLRVPAKMIAREPRVFLDLVRQALRRAR